MHYSRQTRQTNVTRSIAM